MTDPFASLRAEHPGRFASPERIAELSRERFKPWPLPKCKSVLVKYASGVREPEVRK